MHSAARADSLQLLGFNQHLLDQALALAAAHTTPTAAVFAAPVGAHLRHVIEHYDALVHGAAMGEVDYDGRPRDRQLESSPALARHRLALLRLNLDQWTPEMLTRPLWVLGLGGIAGEFEFSVASSVGRELAFVASHTVHHFALLLPHLQRHGVPVPGHFGRAPGTVANDIAMRRAAPPLHLQESSCLSPPQAA